MSNSAINNVILRGEIGSRVYGTNVTSKSDRDEMGIFIEAPSNVLLHNPYDSYVYRDAPKGEPSKPGDLDLTLYSLRKYVALASKGNPTIFSFLWLPSYMYRTVFGNKLINIRNAFLSKNLVKSYLGYLGAQKNKMLGLKAHTVNRPELIKNFGYDTKFAMHALRLGYECIVLCEKEEIVYPIVEDRRLFLKDVRNGKYSFEKIISLIEDLEKELKDKLEKCNWKLDEKTIKNYMIYAHKIYWIENYPEYFPVHE